MKPVWQTLLYGLLPAALLLLLAACSPARRLTRTIEQQPALRTAQVGICLWDAETGQERYAYRAEKLFTPASTAKILTLATCLHTLRDSLPRLAYDWGEDTSEPAGMWFLCGAGDPTTLHPDFAAWQPPPVFLQLHPQTYMVYFLEHSSAGRLERYGKGWAWDDFGFGYSTEISPFPVYGNQVTVTPTVDGYRVVPPELDTLLQTADVVRLSRDPFGPTIYCPMYAYEPAPPPGVPIRFPFFRANQLTPDYIHQLCPAAVVRDEAGALYPMEGISGFWYACPTDTALRRMMHQSDNFFAEQLLLSCAMERYRGFYPNSLRQWATDTLLKLDTGLRWVDGSGLSRYNLVSPRHLCAVLHRLWTTQDTGRLLDLFPEGGKEGTLQGWFADVPVWAKSGSMGGVYCLSGYLRDKKGRMLAFSIMVNGFTDGQKPVKEAVGEVLRMLR